MSGVTDNHGLILPASGEPYSVDITNANNIEIDKKLPLFSNVNSTINDANFNALTSYFTRIAIEDTGIIIAHIVVNLKTTQDLPADSAGNLNLITDFVPAGYRGGVTLGNYIAVLSGSGKGDEIHFALQNGRNLQMRSSGAAFTTTANTTLFANLSWKWDGNLNG